MTKKDEPRGREWYGPWTAPAAVVSLYWLTMFMLMAAADGAAARLPKCDVCGGVFRPAAGSTPKPNCYGCF